MIRDDEITTLSVSQASKITGLCRRTIAKAMDEWAASRGRLGLKFIQPNERRLVRRSELLRWFESQERMVCYG
jgi:hypothetical protein